MQHLTAAISHFSLQTFAELIQHYQQHADDSNNSGEENNEYNEVAELLYTLTDFQHFKTLMQEKKQEIEEEQQRQTASVSASPSVSSSRGTFRPSLTGFGLTITSLNKSK